MKRTKKNQIFAAIALFAIVFSVVSTAVLVIFSQTTQAPNPQDLEKILNSFSWTTQTKVLSGSTLTWTTNK
jgi:hypothetical protein